MVITHKPLIFHLLNKAKPFQTVQLLGNSYKEMAVDGEGVSTINDNIANMTKIDDKIYQTSPVFIYVVYPFDCKLFVLH